MLRWEASFADMSFFTEIRKKSWEWFKERAHGTHAKAWLFLLSFSESSFFLIPPDVLLVPILLVNASRWLYYALFTTLASVLGALFGYLIGAVFYDTVGVAIVEFYGLSSEFGEVSQLFNQNTFWVIFLAAFTPIPFKIFVLAGGLFKVNLLAFVLASVLGRGLRFSLVAYIVRVFGARITYVFLRYTNIATIVLSLIILALVLSYLGIPLIP